MTFDQPRPWRTGQILTTGGVPTHKATSGNSYKPYCPPEEDNEPTQEPEPIPLVQEDFCAGETLPERMVGKVEVCLIGGETVTLCTGELVPADIDGYVSIDETTNKPNFNQGPQKPIELPEQYVPVQEHFCAGELVPDNTEGKVSVCLTNGETLILCAGDVIPDDIDGHIVVDEVSNKPKFAQGPRKPPEIPEQYVPVQETFCPGETLPSDMLGIVSACLEDGTPVVLGAGMPVPADLDGCINVDEVSHRAAFQQNPVKDTDTTLDIDVVCATVLAKIPPDQVRSDEEIETLAKALFEVCDASDEIKTKGDVEACVEAWFEVNYDDPYDTPEELKPLIESCIPPEFIPEQEQFCEGDNLPDDMEGEVVVCLLNGLTTTLQAGDPIPFNIDGCVFVDEVTNRASYQQGPVKIPAPLSWVYVEFDSTVHAPGQPPVGDGSAADPFQIPLPPGAIKELFCAGQTLPDRMVGAVIVVIDGTEFSLVAGDTIPAIAQSCIFVDEVDGIADCVPEKLSQLILEEELFKAGATLPVDMLGSVTVCLSDGNTVDLEAGDTVPANIEGCVIVDEVSNLAGFTQTPVKPTVVTPVKETCSVEIVKTEPASIPSDFAAGDLVTFDVCLINSGNVALTNLVITDSLVGGGTSPATVNGSPIASLAPGAEDYSVTIEHTITQADIDEGGIRNIAKVAATSPNGDVVYAADDAACKFPAVAEECEGDPVNVSSTLPPETLCVEGECTETQFEIEANVLNRDQLGGGVAFYCVPIGPMTSGTWQIPVPAATNPNSLLVLQVTYGWQNGTGQNAMGPASITAPTSAADVGPGTQLYFDDTLANDMDSYAWAFEAATTNSGGTIDFTLDNGPPAEDCGVVMYQWLELSASDGQPLLLSNIDMGASFDTEYQATGDPAWTPIPTGDFMSGDCGTLVLAAGRHTAYDTTGATAQNWGDFDADWFQTSAGAELFDWSSMQGNGQGEECMGGVAGAFIPANTAYSTSASLNMPSSWSHQVFMHHVEFNCVRPCDPNETGIPEDESEEIVLTFTPVCNDLDAEKEITGNVDFTVPAGTSVRLVPIIDGAAVPSEAILCDNTAGAATITPNKAFAFSELLPIVPVGTTASCSASFRLELVAGDGPATALLNNLTASVQE